jgi:non-specific protein-tyrosine kinase
MDPSKLIVREDPRSPAAEAYRALRMNLAYTSLDRPLSSFVVSSPAVGGMDPAVAANLAVVIAQAEQRVILVDADLRRPGMHELFDVPQEPGVTTVMLSHNENIDIPLLETGVPGLSLLTSGSLPPNPADILGSNKMGMLLNQLREQADMVIFQAPPVTVAVDASVLAAQTDGLLLVVRSGHTRRDRIERSKELLQRFRARLLGAVLTDAPDRGLLTGY